MVEATPTKRIAPAEGFRVANSVVSIETAKPASRISLRATSAGARSFEKSLNFALPRKPAETASAKGRHALWLGPDEWLLIDEANPDDSMVPRLPNKQFSAVDVSHRNMAFIVAGPGAAATLNAACPRNLSLAAFPVKTCSRTVLGKAEIVLYRTARDTFRVECWRSYAPYVRDLLAIASKDAHI